MECIWKAPHSDISYIYIYISLPNVGIEWATLLLRIRKVSSSNFNPLRQDNLAEIFRSLLRFLDEHVGISDLI
jgi:hypothetical protein